MLSVATRRLYIWGDVCGGTSFLDIIKSHAIDLPRRMYSPEVISAEGSTVLSFSRTQPVEINAWRSIVGVFDVDNRHVGIRVLARSRNREVLDTLVPISIGSWYGSPFECSAPLLPSKAAYLDIWLD